ncbi:MAG: dephospho-CoA kinase, partial [Chlamydiae bacterium]|nr:dephospho-CoA kinase [Chlamydiota bacterium]
MKRLAVTGSLASGKSTVCRVFALSGAYVVSTDEIVHSLLASRADIQQRIVDLLGPGVVVRGQLDRKAIAK